MGEPAGTGRVDADVRGSDLRNTDLCAVPEQKPGIYAKRRCRLYPEEREAVEEKLLIPYQGKIRGISMVDTKKEAEWKMTEEGIQVVIPQEYREGETPIAIVWKIEQ